MSLPPELQDGETEVGVLADGVAGPSGGGLERGSANEAHGAVDDNGIGFITLDHADIEEARILAVHHIMERTALAVAVILWRLHQPDLGIGEDRDQIAEPIGC